MKTIRHIACALAIAAMGIATAATAQKLPPTQVPAPVMQAFTKDFPNAMDVEWKLSGTQYKVEFETGLFFVDHEVWYDASGRMLRHEEEISASDLPAAVVTAINTEFPGYRVDDVERITMDGAVSYVVELKMKGYQEWKAAFDPQGKLIDKRPD